MARQNVMTGGGTNAPAKKQAEEGSKRDVEEKARPVGVPQEASTDPTISVMARYDIGFTHVPTNKSVTFPGAMQSYDDSFTANFQGTAVYGRMDDIVSYQSTKRSINFSFDVMASSDLDAKKNLEKLSTLQSFLYPSYEGGPEASVTTIQAPPLIRVSFTNLIKSNATNKGLLGYVNTVQNAPDFEAGFVTDKDGNMYPKKYTINLAFTVLHEHELGWYKDGLAWKWRGDKNEFPYDRELSVGQSTKVTQAAAEKPTQQKKAAENKINKSQSNT